MILFSGCTETAEIPLSAVPETNEDVSAAISDTNEYISATLPEIMEDQSVIYPVPACYKESEQVTAKLDGQKLPVIRCHDEYDYCSFAFHGKITLTIDAGEAVKSVSVSPLAKEIPFEKNGKTVTITMTQPEYLIVKINNKREIVIAADPIEKNVPASSGEGIWNVAALGADGTAQTSATAVIQQAIDDASAAGGGTVYVPVGVYSIGNLQLKSNVHLYLEAGAVLRADRTDEFKLFATTKHSNGTSFSTTYALYTEPGCENITIDGRGTIDCLGLQYFLEKSWFNAAFVPNRCDNLKLDGIIIRDTGFWGTVITYCRDVSVTNTKHFNKTHTIGGNDCMDIVGSQNVLVRRTIGLSRDDPYSIKTYVTHSMFEGIGRAAENIVFEDCFAWTRCAAFKLGWGINMGMSDIVFRDCYAYSCNIGLGVTHFGGSAPIRNVTFENIDIENFMLADSRWLLAAISTYNPNAKRTEWGSVSDLTFRNINVRGQWNTANLLSGYDKYTRISNVHFSGITLLGKSCSALEEMDVKINEFTENVTVSADS